MRLRILNREEFQMKKRDETENLKGRIISKLERNEIENFKKRIFKFIRLPSSILVHRHPMSDRLSENRQPTPSGVPLQTSSDSLAERYCIDIRQNKRKSLRLVIDLPGHGS